MECSEMNFVTTCVSLDSCGCCSLLFLLVFCFDFLRFEDKKIVPDTPRNPKLLETFYAPLLRKFGFCAQNWQLLFFPIVVYVCPALTSLISVWEYEIY